MAQKVGLQLSGVKELKLGKTFAKGYKDEAYHTIRYDFKPASVDSQNVGSLEVVDKEVTLNVPLTGGAGSANKVVFKGNRTPSSKDCLLIIDHSTGEIVLERISQHIRVKKTRMEGSNRKMMPKGKTLQEAPYGKPSPSQNHSSSSPHVARPSPSHRSPPSKSPSRGSTVKSQSASLTAGSMPMLNFEEEQKRGSIMSDSSSDSDSNSCSSSSCDSDSDSDAEMQNAQQNPSNTAVPSQNYTLNGHAPNNGISVGIHKPSPTSILSDLELSEED